MLLNIFLFCQFVVYVCFFCYTSSGRTWRSQSVSFRGRGWADPMAFGVPQLQPPPCTLVTLKLARDQVWRNRKELSSHCRDSHYLTRCNICKPVISDDQRFYPTSPLKTGTPRSRRRSQSASVRFKDAKVKEDNVRNADGPTINQWHFLTVM